MADGLEGSRWVRVFGPALREAHRWWPRARYRMEVRRHALKLRFWPAQSPVEDSGALLDMDWEWIRACRGESVGELRIEDEIGGHRNIRIVFFVGPTRAGDPLPAIWILAALPKKRHDWTPHQISIFRGRRKLILQRFYGS